VLARIASELDSGGRTLVLLHGNADPDALASAFAVMQCFPGIVICVPGGLDRMSKLMASALGIETVEDCGDMERDRTLVLDTSGPEQLVEAVDLEGALVVDHHARNPKWEALASVYHCDESKSSCSEIVYEMLRTAGKDLPRDAAVALMLGILTDTGNFKFAKPGALRTFADLMQSRDIEMDEVTGVFVAGSDVSERVSQLKGAQRLRFWKVGENIVAISHGSAFEASVCKALLSVGADVSYVGSQRDERFRISGRATQAIVRRGLHLGRLMNGVGLETANGGGGHPGAAGITGTGDVEAILNMLAEETVRAIKRLDSARD